MLRVAAAVALVEGGLRNGGHVSVRKAAHMFQVPKSTVHRYVLAARGARAAAPKGPRRAVSPPKKCGIPFLLTADQHPVRR